MVSTQLVRQGPVRLTGESQGATGNLAEDEDAVKEEFRERSNVETPKIG